MTTTQPHFTLNNGVTLPQIGFGVYQTPPEETMVAFEKASAKLGLEQIDLLILHQANPTEFDKTIASYKALETLLADGKLRAIGVSNFLPVRLERLLNETEVVPTVNQIEVHPYTQQRELQDFNRAHGILTQAWSPIGGLRTYSNGDTPLTNPTIVAIGEAHGKSPAQVMLRWHIQEGRQVIPKSVKSARIAENFDVFDFELSREELVAIDALEQGMTMVPDELDFNAFVIDIPEA